MKLNRNVTITGNSVTLVPYRQEHVAWYHAWMQDPKLQEATASEPLTLQEEYDMQLSWADEADSEIACYCLLLQESLHLALTL
ncbi:hypothetical protein ABBQ32_000978 [Trebouxia sp. C0010 RCD-2024]